MSSIPIIDIASLGGSNPSSRTVTVREIGTACEQVGFMYIRRHGMAAATVRRLIESVVGFFELPADEKLQLAITPDNYRGYIPLGFFTPNECDGRHDNYEGYKLHFETALDDPVRDDCSLYGPNKWPDRPAGFRISVLNYWQECDRITGLLLGALAEYLGIDTTAFDSMFDTPLTNMTLLHYPPQTRDAGGVGIHAHKDTDALTILAPDSTGGLKARVRGHKDWLSVDAPADVLIVNIGDMLELWSGGRFVSTPHKVVTTSGENRYSFPYFSVPRYDTVVKPLCQPLAGFDRTPVHVGDISREVWRTNWPDAKPKDRKLDLGTIVD